MIKPIINKITPFDAENDNAISFSWDGNQSHANRLIIYDIKTLEIIYDKKIETFELQHVLTANTLENGKQWIAQIVTFDVNDTPSEPSDKILFYTFKTPQFYFCELKNGHPAQEVHEIKSGKIIGNQNYQALIYYQQENYEDLQSHKFYLYDGTKTLLYESETMFNSYNIKFNYTGLNNHTVYYLRCIGITVNGMEVDTGYIQVYTDYQEPDKYGVIYAENDPDHGYIKYHTNIIVIKYNGNKIFKYIDDLIDLREDSIYYDTGFVIRDDFTLKLRGMYLNRTNTLLELRNTKYSLVLSSYLYDDGTIRFKITVFNGVSNYILYSTPLTFEEKDMVHIAIRRKNDIYKLEVFVDSLFTLENNMWYGIQKPSTPSRHDIWIDDLKPLTYMTEKEKVTKHLGINEPTGDILSRDAWEDIWIGGE